MLNTNIYIYIYIYIERERERERDTHIMSIRGVPANKKIKILLKEKYLNILWGKHIWTMNLETLEIWDESKYNFQLKHRTWETTHPRVNHATPLMFQKPFFLYIYVHPIIVSSYFKWFYGYIRTSYFTILFLIYLLCMCTDHVVFVHAFDLI